jgi:CRISPR-associated endoribonuclease Cas6
MSRLLVKLVASNDTNYEMEHHKQLQGLIYSLLEGSEYSGLHDGKGYKFFSFSGLFPFTYGLRRGDRKSLLISSPNSQFISYLREQLNYLDEITIGAMRFRIVFTKKIDIALSRFTSGFGLITGSPIVQAIQPYLRPEHVKDKLFWSTDFPASLFLKQLGDNLVKKYNRFYGLESKDKDKGKDKDKTEDHSSIFYKSTFLKQISTKIYMTKKDVRRTVVIGSNWLFNFGHCSPLLQFGLDAGLGGLNSLGFGFMNVVSGRELEGSD